MFFRDDDRANVTAISDILKNNSRDILHIKTTNDKNAEKIDQMIAYMERIISRLDLFIREFESIRPLVSEIKHAVYDVNEHCKSSKKKK